MKSIVLFATVLRIIIITVLIAFTIFVNAQSVAVNTTGNSADASAMLDISSDSKGVLITRLGTAQRTAVSNPAEGLLVYDTDTKGFWYFSLGVWNEVPKSSGGGFSLPYNGISSISDRTFSVTNSSPNNGRVAIYGKGTNIFTGLIPGNPIGVWGEEDGGTGVMGNSKTGIGVFGYSQNNKGVYGKSTGEFGTAGWFENTSTGNGVFARSHNGVSGTILIDNENNNNTAFQATTFGTGNAGVFYKDNTAGNVGDLHKPAVFIANISKGNALKINSLHAPSVNSGVEVEYEGQAYGVDVNSTSGGILSTSTSTTKAAITANNFSGGQAIHGAAIADFSETIYAENTGTYGHAIHAKATNGTGVGVWSEANTNTIYKAAILGTNNGIGAGVMGTNGNNSWGIGVYGELNTGTGGGFAGYFVNNGSGTGSQALRTLNNSLGINTSIQTQNVANNKEALEIIHSGTGNIAIFKNYGGEVGSISNNGNIQTAGTVTVKGNKGIVRSSSTSQMRYEAVSSPAVVSAGIAVGTTLTVNITFSAAFSSAPAVSVGNLLSGFAGPCHKLSTSITNVTTTGCTLNITNNGSSSTGVVSGVWKIIAIGAE